MRNMKFLGKGTKLGDLLGECSPFYLKVFWVERGLKAFFWTLVWQRPVSRKLVLLLRLTVSPRCRTLNLTREWSRSLDQSHKRTSLGLAGGT